MKKQSKAENEHKRTCSDLATELFETKGKRFCVGLTIHLIMYISGSYKFKSQEKED